MKTYILYMKTFHGKSNMKKLFLYIYFFNTMKSS